MAVVQHDVLQKMCYEIFLGAGIPDEDADIISNHLVNSHLAGHDSHGTWLLPNYVRGMQRNYVKWDEREVERDTPTLQIINGNGANGIVSVTKSVEIAVEKAKQSTFGFVGLNHVTHIGRLGDFPPRIADQGMIGTVWLNGGGLFMTPFGSAERKLRPEPFAFSAPRQNGPPFMLDMTMCTVAGGKIQQKLIREEPLPEGWVIDEDGNSVTDPNRYFNEANSTGVLPLGGLQFGHKGFGLAMMVELLVGPLSHAGCTGSKGGGGGVMVLAIDIEAFTDLDTYKEEVEGLAEWVCSAKPLPGFDRIYAPGEIEVEKRQQMLEDGIDLPDPTWKELGEVAEGLGIQVPSL